MTSDNGVRIEALERVQAGSRADSEHEPPLTTLVPEPLKGFPHHDSTDAPTSRALHSPARNAPGGKAKITSKSNRSDKQPVTTFNVLRSDTTGEARRPLPKGPNSCKLSRPKGPCRYDATVSPKARSPSRQPPFFPHENASRILSNVPHCVAMKNFVRDV